MLTTDRLVIGYRNRALLQDLNLQLSPGELVCLIGPNGVGKSTLLRTLAGMHPPLAGAVYLDGQEVHRLPVPELARRLAVVLTGPPTGMVLAFDLSARLGLCPKEEADRVRAHLDSVGLPTRLEDTGVARGDLLPFMRADKKNAGGSLRLILTRGIGEAFQSPGVEESLVADFLATAA